MEITYYSQIQANPHFTLKNFAPLIKRGVKSGIACKFVEPVKLGDLFYTIYFEPQQMSLTIEWEEDGEQHRQLVDILQEPSNLPTRKDSSVYYFLCPLTGVKSRVLYKIGFCFWSRKAFRAYYPNQMESHFNRVIAYREPPYRKRGKYYYRGRITPYGLRCKRYEEQTRKGVAALWAYL